MSETTHLKIVSTKEAGTYKVDAVTQNGDIHFEHVATIKNWTPQGDPSISIPYYIPNSMLEEIVKIIQESEPPK